TGASIIRVQLRSLGEHSPCQEQVGFRSCEEKLSASEVIGIGLDILCGCRLNRFFLGRQQLDLQLVDDGVVNLVLNGKNIGQLPIIALCPDMAAVFAVNKLSGDPDAGASPADAALKHESDL